VLYIFLLEPSSIAPTEARMNAARQAARQAKDAYDQAVSQRSNSQRGVNDLLQRKSNWSDTDVSRFTTLIRQDHLYEQDEVRAKAKVHETEDAVEREFSELMRSILARYHEEQVWSDKIRSASTYGSLVALGLNLFIFVVAIVVVEPWKRRRLAQTFEKKIEQMSIENAAMVDGNMKEISQRLEEQGKLLTQYAFALSVHMADDITDSPSTFERDDKPSQDWVLAIAVGAGAVVSGVISWQACSWFGR
jgi:sensitive to high expression protein 9